MPAPTASELMAQCVELARRGQGFVEPNPMVGSIVVKDGEIVGRGWHKSLGGPHAEIEALRDAGDAAKGGELYVTLEPCSTIGRTPPCSEAVIEAGITTVVIGTKDPNPKHAGAALDVLRTAGLKVECGVLEDQCVELIQPFVHGLQADRPIVVAKWAATLDGKIATRTGDSQWITCEEARRAVHEERARSDAILIGVGTLLADDPQLTTRHVSGDSPRPVVLDTHLRAPLDARLFEDVEREPLVYCGEEVENQLIKPLRSSGVVVQQVPTVDGRVDIGAVLRDLKARGVGRLMVEGGPTVLSTFLAQDAVDWVQAYVAPKVLGDSQGRSVVDGRSVDKIQDTIDFEWTRVDQIGADLRLLGRVANKIS